MERSATWQGQTKKQTLFTGGGVWGTQIPTQASVLMPLPLFSPPSVRWWAGRKQRRTPRGASASRWCGWQPCSWPSWQLNETTTASSPVCNKGHRKCGRHVYHPGGSAPRCQGQWGSRAPSAAEGTSGLSGWVWSGTTPEWTNVAVWGFSQPGRPWNQSRFSLEEQKHLSGPQDTKLDRRLNWVQETTHNWNSTALFSDEPPSDESAAGSPRFYLSPGPLGLWCDWHRRRCRSWNDRHNKGMSLPRKTALSVGSKVSINFCFQKE